uniref:Uncharacterized protein n=1 Tax=Trypanosoma vivax (strain Y486) TaxID=1055687 RepID=G0TXK5_TRYVY|nr:conserved hypothetical protein [Trypanosoma vivax Y486]
MTERFLLIRHAQVERYFAIGMDFPSARVFDVATGALVTVVSVPQRSRTSLATVSLTSLALGMCNEHVPKQRQQNRKEDNQQMDDHAIRTCFTAVGLSDGTVLLHNVAKDVLVGHIPVSDTRQPVTAMAFCGKYLFCLLMNSFVQVVDCMAVERVAKNFRVQPNAGAIAVVEEQGATSAICQEAGDGSPLESVFRIFVSGSTNAVYTLKIGRSATQENDVACHRVASASLERVVSFASQASRSEMAWMGGTQQCPVALTANAQEGVVRVWDASASCSSSAAVSRCRRSLMCGQRIVNICVREAVDCVDTNLTESTVEARTTSGLGSKISSSEALVVVTTLTGSILVWVLGTTLLPAVAEPIPQPPTFQLVSQEEAGRLLFAALLGRTSLLLLRGKFAVPRFDVVDVCSIPENVRVRPRSMKSSLAWATTALGTAGDVALCVLPMKGKPGGRGEDTVTHAELEVLDHAWATHGRQQRRRILLASRAVNTSTEGFVTPTLPHAKSVKDLPLKNLTLEQRLKQLSISSTAELFPQQQKHQQHALGLATVPLYQALHANDTSAVMELLTVASRSASDIRATVLGLQLPYCLQLLQILSQRVRGASSRSPLFQWIDAIIHYRGVEMHQVQRQYRRQGTLLKPGEPSRNKAEGDNKGSEVPCLGHHSPPKDFVAPILHQYTNMIALYDKIATMYGRISIFQSVRPSEQGVFTNSDNGIVFPSMFTEIRCAGGVYRSLRVRSRKDSRVPRRGRSARGEDGDEALALIRKARKIATRHAAEAGGDGDEDDVGAGDDLDIGALDNMVLSGSSGSDEDNLGSNMDDGEEEELEGGKRTRASKRIRVEKEMEMLAESERGSSFGVESQDADADTDEFGSSSDVSEDFEKPADSTEIDDEEEEEEEEEDNGAGDDACAIGDDQHGDFPSSEDYENEYNSADDGDNEEEDDGIAPDLKRLPELRGGAEDDDEGNREVRRHRRVKTNK